jgi:hypothetical protein
MVGKGRRKGALGQHAFDEGTARSVPLLIRVPITQI